MHYIHLYFPTGALYVIMFLNHLLLFHAAQTQIKGMKKTFVEMSENWNKNNKAQTAPASKI